MQCTYILLSTYLLASISIHSRWIQARQDTNLSNLLSLEVKSNLSDAHVLGLLELVFKGREELRVDFHCKLFNVLDGFFQVLFFVAGPSLHFGVPRVDLLDCFGRKNEGGSSDL